MKGEKISKIHGNLSGLKPNQVRKLERIYRRRIPQSEIITAELARYMTGLSLEIGREIGVIIDRKGRIHFVVVGGAGDIAIPDLKDFRIGPNRLRGVRFVYTTLHSQGLNRHTLIDISLLRLDIITAIEVLADGMPGRIHIAHLLPPNQQGRIFDILDPVPFYQMSINFSQFISSIEEEINRSRERGRDVDFTKERAILVGVGTESKQEIEESVEELKELARTCRIKVLDVIIQRIKAVDGRYFIGSGKIKELSGRALQLGANMVCFDHELTPDQFTNICAVTELKVIDRPQLILDIFARRAHTLDGKLQVELAQLKYMLPRLKGKGTAMSRLMGGIGGRGPGETKLEIDRRRARERITRLEKRLEVISRRRRQKRVLRQSSTLPICSIIGYTNAGKSTLLNSLTNSNVFTEDLLFATLDTATRRLRFPREREVIITDTVGFIHSLPQTLIGAFKATLEELEDADFLLHLVDISSPVFEAHIRSVNRILKELGLDSKPTLICFNKIDLVDKEIVKDVARRYNAVCICATEPKTLLPLLEEMESRIESL